MNSFNVHDLKENCRFTEDLLIDNTFLLLNKGAKFSPKMIKALKDWQFTKIYSTGTISAADRAVATAVRNRSSSSAAPNRITGASACVEKTESVTMADMGINVSSAEIQKKEAIPDTQDIEKKFDFSHITDEVNRMAVVQNVYNEYYGFVFKIYTYYATHKKIDMDLLSQKVKELCIFVKSNRRYVLQVQTPDDSPKNFLIAHSIRSTVLAITVGLQLHMSITKMTELGVACILHEIGMIRIPSQLYLSQRNLSSIEKNLLNTHPIVSYTILKSFEAPLSICLAVLEHHEKEDGTGYPRHMKTDKISLYAKIISVVCSFEAITAPRTYKEAASSFEAMVELLQNQTKQYDELVIKALLYSLSLFPIGSYVFLSDGKIGRVSDVNPENPKNPIVQLVGERDANGKIITIKTSNSGIRIVRVLNKQETADIVKTTGVI